MKPKIMVVFFEPLDSRVKMQPKQYLKEARASETQNREKITKDPCYSA
jgi:hypothetical protein